MTSTKGLVDSIPKTVNTKEASVKEKSMGMGNKNSKMEMFMRVTTLRIIIMEAEFIDGAMDQSTSVSLETMK